MSRNFYVTGRPASSGGLTAGRPSLRATTPRDPSIPPLAAGAGLEPSEVADPPLHKFQAIENLLLSFAAGFALVAAFYIMFFVET